MAEQLLSYLPIKQVIAATGMSRSWLYEAVKRGDFPAAMALGARAVAWDAVDIAAWQQERISLNSARGQ